MNWKLSLKILVVLLFFIGGFSFLNQIYTHRNIFQKKFDKAKYKKLFDHSQWIITNKEKATISDADLYTHMAFEYVNGVDPTTQDFEVPPLGKYLIGQSILFFNNQRVASLLFALACLFLIFYFTFINTMSPEASLFSVFLTFSNWLFVDQIIYSPQLEIFQLFFLLIVFIFFSIYQKKHQFKYLLLTGVAFGGFISIKAAFIHYLLIIVLIITYYFFGKKSIKQIIIDLLVINTLAIAVYISFYARFFLLGGNIIKFIQVQKWIIGFYTVHSNIETVKLLGSYISLIYANRWRFWSEGYPIINYKHWSLLWPIIHLSGIISLIMLFVKKELQKNPATCILAVFIIVYNIFLFFVPIWPRYLLLLFVPQNIIIAVFVNKYFLVKH